MVSVALLSSCAAVDRPAMSQFEPLSENTFKYSAKADLIYRYDTSDGEKARMEWLEQYLSDNGLCKNGYRIDSRKAVLIRKDLLGDWHDIFYYGHCVQ